MIGTVQPLPILRLTSIGAYLDGGSLGDVLLPKRFLPPRAAVGDTLQVFLYHDSEGRIIATTQTPYATLGELALLEVVSKNRQGAFLDWGLMKDLFLPLSQQTSRIMEGSRVLVMVYEDAQTGRLAASEKIDRFLSDEVTGLHVNQPVALSVWRQTDLGWVVVVEGRYRGLIFNNDIFEPLHPGQKLEGYIRTIHEDGRLDVVPGKAGHSRVPEAGEKILASLRAAGGYLPYHDGSPPEELYEAFGISKKVFKAALGGLLKQGTVQKTQTGIRLVES